MAVGGEQTSTSGRVDAFRYWRDGGGLPVLLRDAGRCCRLAAWSNSTLQLSDGATHFGFVHSGGARLCGSSGVFALRDGMYFALPGSGTIGGQGQGIVISQDAYCGLFQLGGPIESQGRLQYIDGCSDTLLISPVVMGDPCLNLLVLPPLTCQTAHTHPSFRAGIVVAGHGWCQTAGHTIRLEPGTIFVIDADGLHSFHTAERALTVIAFHPDSDFGPRHDDHPMVNRTIVDGVSAARLTLAERRVDEDLL